MTVKPKFKFLSWNIRRFQGKKARAKEVSAKIDTLKPDVFGILEVLDNTVVRELIRKQYKDYNFGLTDGDEGIEILVGWRRGKFDQVFYTQKRDFKVGQETLRPGALLSIRIGKSFYNFLYLHTDSGVTKKDYGNRQKMFKKIWSLKKALDREAGGSGKARLIVLGDLNTMGRKKMDNLKKISADEEIRDLGKSASANGMKMLAKEFDHTWHKWNGKAISNLDHIIATRNIEFRSIAASVSGEKVPVRVIGWNQLSGAALTHYLTNISDHSMIYSEVK